MKKAYPKYRSIELPWLDEIPEHWGMVPNKHLLKFSKELVGKQSGSYTLLSLTLNGVIKRDMENPKGKFPAEFDSYQVVESKDLIFCLFDVEETPRAVGLSRFDGMITGAYTVAKCLTNTNQEYLYYYYLFLDNKKSLKYYYTGLRNVIAKDTFSSIKTPLPPLPEQRTIAAFLDHKCRLIDTFIAKKTRLIELLQEQKQAIINQAVTRGLDPDVSMKPSGIEWLGDIPAHWEVKKLKYVAVLNPGRKKLDVSSLAVFLPMEKVGEDGSIDCSTKGKVEDLQSGYTYFEKGDVIVAKITPCFENGKGAYLKGLETEVGFGSTEFHVLRPDLKTVLPEYLHSILRSEKFRSLGEYHMVGSAGQKRVPTSFISNFAIGFPEMEEQKSIIKFIEKESSFIDDTINRIEQELILVQEYKTTLIAEAVTGKIDVRGWKPEQENNMSSTQTQEAR